MQRLEARQAAASVAQSPAPSPTGVAAAPPATPDASTPPIDRIPDLTLETYVAATREVDRERFQVANLGRLREVVFGAQDGILSTVALVTAVAVGVGPRGQLYRSWSPDWRRPWQA